MQDAEVLKHITGLIDEEKQLRGAGTPTDDAQRRLRHVEEQLDQCWDLLRQRRAKAEFGENPDTAQVRDARTVEGYKG